MSTENKIVRTRYAPSPTGLFHIGGARTALFNYLFAKKNNGDFIVRIEDTDIERNVSGGIESQLLNLKWLKIFPDESIINPGNYGPYIQSEKFKQYKKLAFSLLEQKKAYRCFCSPEKLEKERQKAIKENRTPKYNRACLNLTESQIEQKLNKKINFSIRLKISDNKIFKWNDLIRGEISIPSDALTDPIILKSNEIASYNFAVVIDDFDMKITHVIRGEEHISNTPYQLAIKEALNYDTEVFYGHLSIIVDENGKKISKRNIDVKQFIEDYKSMGFLPEAITNFMYLLGLSVEDNKEIFNIIEAIKKFDIDKVSKSSTTFDFKKMEWISSEHFKQISDSSFLAFVEPFITLNLDVFKENKNMVILLFKNQISYAKQINELIEDVFFSKKTLKYFKKDFKFVFEKESIKLISFFLKKISALKTWNIEEINKIIDASKKNFNVSGKNLFLPIRIYSTHNEHGPELNKIITFSGKEKIISNIQKFLKEIS